jgi:hypothetical protein
MNRLIVLAVSVCVLVLASGTAHADEKKKPHQYAGATKCRSCHEKEAIGGQYGKWLDSNHAKAYGTLASEKAKKWGKEKGIDDPQTSDKCVKCHVAGHGAPRQFGMKYAEVRSDPRGVSRIGRDYRRRRS